MKANGHDQPTSKEWANAPLHIARTDWANEPDDSTLKLEKRIERHGRTYTQHVRINIHQLRGMAQDHLKRRPPGD